MIVARLSFNCNSLSIDHKAGARNFGGERQNGVKKCELLVNTHTSVFSLTTSLVLHDVDLKKMQIITIWNGGVNSSVSVTPIDSWTLCVCSCITSQDMYADDSPELR